MASASDNREAGYGRPPQSGQFKKGQSGNPKGRPKAKAAEPIPLADLPTDKIFRDQLYSSVKARSADGVSEMQFAEALVRTMQSEALKGRRLVMKDLLAFMRDTEREEAARAQEYSDALETLKRRNKTILDLAAERGGPVPEVYPHPDDIVLDQTTLRYTLIGPFEKAETPYFERWRAIQRLLMIWSEMTRRRSSETAHDESLHLWAFAQVIDRQMPPSYQWPEQTWVDAVMGRRSLSTKALIKEQKTEISNIATGYRAGKLSVALPEQNINILNSIAHAIRAALDQASTHALQAQNSNSMDRQNLMRS